MADYLTEEEQITAIKKWWQENGTSIILALILGLGGFFGWNYYQKNTSEQSEAASLIYNQLVQLVAIGQNSEMDQQAQDTMKTLASELKNNFAGTTYSNFGSLFLARFAVQEENYDQAANELEELIGSTKQASIKYTAQARLAQVYIQQNKLTEALALVEQAPDAAYVPLFEEAKGDALYRQGKQAEAIGAYEKAQQSAEAQGLDTQLLQRKIDSLSSRGDA